MLLDINNSNEILSYGKAEQNKISRLTNNALKNIQTNELHHIDELVEALISIINKQNAKTLKLFSKQKDPDAEIKRLTSKLESTYLNARINVFDMEKILEETLIVDKNLRKKIEEAQEFISQLNHENKQLLEQTIHGLNVSLVVTSQMILQINNMIDSNNLLIKKIQSMIKNTIPAYQLSRMSTKTETINELNGLLEDCSKNKQEHNLFVKRRMAHEK